MDDAPVTDTIPGVEELLPHRGRFLLIERVVAIDEQGVEAVGRFTEADCEGHFPGQPVVPGVLLLEGLAQTMAAAHLQRPSAVGGTPFLAGFDKVRFRRAVLPPVEVRYTVTFGEERFGLTRAKGTVWVDGKRAVTASLLATVIPAETGA